MASVLHICFFTLIAVGFVLMLLWRAPFALIYIHLEKEHPQFYKRIGSPALIDYPYFIGWWKRPAKGLNNTAIWVDSGLPKGFPKDRTCHNFARYITFMHRYFSLTILAWGLCAAAIALALVLTSS